LQKPHSSVNLQEQESKREILASQQYFGKLILQSESRKISPSSGAALSPSPWQRHRAK